MQIFFLFFSTTLFYFLNIDLHDRKRNIRCHEGFYGSSLWRFVGRHEEKCLARKKIFLQASHSQNKSSQWHFLENYDRVDCEHG
jgi:hypothetical protein